MHTAIPSKANIHLAKLNPEITIFPAKSPTIIMKGAKQIKTRLWNKIKKPPVNKN